MKRTRLIWFAGGLALGIIICGLTVFARPAVPDRKIYLSLQGSGYDLLPKAEREKVPLDDRNEYERWKSKLGARKYVSSSVIEEALACGGRKFDVKMPTHSLDVMIELTPDNTKAANCLLASARKREIPFVISDSGQ